MEVIFPKEDIEDKVISSVWGELGIFCCELPKFGNHSSVVKLSSHYQVPIQSECLHSEPPAPRLVFLLAAMARAGVELMFCNHNPGKCLGNRAQVGGQKQGGLWVHGLMIAAAKAEMPVSLS